MKNLIHKTRATTAHKGTALIVFGKDLPVEVIDLRKFDIVVADKKFEKDIENLGSTFVEIDTLIDPGSVYEADAFLKELSLLNLPDGTRLSKSFVYEGYELWWVHYNNFFQYFCLPYTRYRKLLGYLRDFQKVSFYQPPHKKLFCFYLRAHECDVVVLREPVLRNFLALPVGVLIQIFITFLSVIILAVRKRRILVFTGDNFEQSQDYDFRMKFIYEELRHRKLSFVEFIRSLESWKIVIKHAVTRRRPVIYYEAVASVGRFMSILSGGRWRARQRFGSHVFESEMDQDARFKLLIATQYFLSVYDDIWGIRIMKLILRMIGIKAAFIPATTERNFHTVLGCKLNNIPTVGILHGVAFRYATPYDFMDGFDGKKMLSVDAYGVWSEWWRDYYIKYSKAYKPEQLYVSGPMRPLGILKESDAVKMSQDNRVRVLFISEQVAVPSEVMPYLRELIDRRDIELTIKFRPSRDGFEEWLLLHEPQILKLEHLRIVKGGMQEAIHEADVVVGSYSTGVLEALLQLKVPIFVRGQKWGDYFSMAESDKTRCFFAENPEELSERIKNARTLSSQLLADLRERYFGDPYKNGSKWVVDRLEKILKEGHTEAF